MKVQVNPAAPTIRSENDWKEGDVLSMNNDPNRLFILTNKLRPEKQTIAGHILFDAVGIREDGVNISRSCYYRVDGFTLFTGTITLNV